MQNYDFYSFAVFMVYLSRWNVCSVRTRKESLARLAHSLNCINVKRMNSFGHLSLSLPICRMGVPLHLEVPHVPLSFPIPQSTAPGIPQHRFTFSHTLGAVAHHVHQALARQDYYPQHALRARDVPQPVGVSGSDTGADGAAAGEGAPLAKRLWYIPNRGPSKAPRFRAPRKLWLWYDGGGVLFRCPVASAHLQQEGEASARRRG